MKNKKRKWNEGRVEWDFTLQLICYNHNRSTLILRKLILIYTGTSMLCFCTLKCLRCSSENLDAICSLDSPRRNHLCHTFFFLEFSLTRLVNDFTPWIHFLVELEILHKLLIVIKCWLNLVNDLKSNFLACLLNESRLSNKVFITNLITVVY